MVSSGMLHHVALTRATQRNILVDTILHGHHRENLKSYIMFKRLMNNLNKYAIINPSQYGFQINFSMDNAIYALTALNNKSKVKGIFCDIEKAFDCVNRDILLLKLKIYGVTGTTRELFSQFLRNRHQCVNLKVNVSGRP
jgi:hypothetical protein